MLYDDPSPICPGCQAVTHWSEVPRIERFYGVADDCILAEDLMLRLDLHLLERELQRQPCGKIRTLEWEAAGSCLVSRG